MAKLAAPFALFILFPGCTSDEVSNRADKAVEAAVQTVTLTGLYEGSGGALPNQLCVIDRGSGNARFGLVVRGSGEAACSGAGSAVRRGDAVVLTMEGDEACAIEARLVDRNLTFPAELPAGCNYYCGAGAAMGGTTFAKVGGSAEDAMRAIDLVGDPLCSAMGTP